MASKNHKLTSLASSVHSDYIGTKRVANPANDQSPAGTAYVAMMLTTFVLNHLTGGCSSTINEIIIKIRNENKDAYNKLNIGYS